VGEQGDNGGTRDSGGGGGGGGGNNASTGGGITSAGTEYAGLGGRRGANSVSGAASVTTNDVASWTSSGKVQITYAATGGTASSNQTICSGTQPANITLSSYAGTIQWQVSTDNSNWSNITNATASPLTSAQMGTLTATRYYRAYVGDVAYSNTVTVTVTSSITWTGNTNRQWGTSSNWNPAISPAGCVVSIPDGLTNYPEMSGDASVQSLTVSGGTFSLGSSVLTLTGNLTNNGSITGSGEVMMAGTAAQTISGAGTLSNLEVNKTTGTAAARTVTITSGAGNMQSLTGTLTLTAGTLATNGNLTLKSSSAGTARVAEHTTAGTLSGSVTVERWIDAGPSGSRRPRQWRMLGFPYSTALTLSSIGGMAIDVTPPSLSMMYFSESGADASMGTGSRNAGYISYTDLNQQISAGQGVMAWLYGTSGRAGTGNLDADITIVSAGTLREDGNAVTVNLSYTSSNVNPGWNLVANPYASSISWSGITRSTGVQTTVYRWNPASEGWTTRNTAGGQTGGADNIIESGAAFFVRATAASQTLTIPQSAKTATSTGMPHHSRAPSRLNVPMERIAPGSASLAGIRVKVSGQGNPQPDDIYIDFSREDATSGFDRQYDAVSMSRTSGADVSVMDRDGVALAVQFDLPIREAGMERRYYPMQVSTPSVGETTVDISIEGKWNPRNTVCLIDTKERKTYALQYGNLTHTFRMNTLKEQGRFILAVNHVTQWVDGSQEGIPMRLLGNPVSTGRIDLLMAYPWVRAKRWSLTSAQGLKVAEGQFPAADGNLQYSLPVPAMQTPGVYVLRVEMDDNKVHAVQVVRL